MLRSIHTANFLGYAVGSITASAQLKGGCSSPLCLPPPPPWLRRCYICYMQQLCMVEPAHYAGITLPQRTKRNLWWPRGAFPTYHIAATPMRLSRDAHAIVIEIRRLWTMQYRLPLHCVTANAASLYLLSVWTTKKW